MMENQAYDKSNPNSRRSSDEESRKHSQSGIDAETNGTNQRHRKSTSVSDGAHNPPDVPTSTVHMKRQITLLGGVAMIVGTMIGSGIFVSSGNLMRRTDSAAGSLIMWTLCGVLSMFTSLSYIELGTLVPRSGGEHAYFQEAFKPLHRYLGELPAFLFSWTTVILLKPSSQAINSLSFGQYTLKPIISYVGINADWENSEDYEWAKKCLALVCCWGIAALNIMNVKLAERVQIGFTACKISAISVVIGVGLYNVITNGRGNIPAEYDQGTASISDYALAAYSGQWAYDGWNNLNFLTEELVNPRRNLPLAIFIGIPFVMVCYVAVNLSYLAVLTKTEITGSTAVAVDATESTLGVMKWVIPVLVALSTIGTANGSQFTAGRIGYVSSRDGHLPSIISYVHAAYLSPTIAILLNTIIAMFFIFASSVNDLIDFFGFVSWIFYALALTAVLVLRYTKPDGKRSIKVPIFVPIIALLVSLFLVLAPLIEQPSIEHIYVLIFFVIGIVLYTIFVYKKMTPAFSDSLTTKIQMITYVAPSSYRED